MRCSSKAPAVSISAMPAMSISPVKSGVGGIGTRRRFSADVELGGLGHGPGAGGDQAEGRAPELDAEARRAGLGREDKLMVALQHGTA